MALVDKTYVGPDSMLSYTGKAPHNYELQWKILSRKHSFLSGEVSPAFITLLKQTVRSA